MLPLSVAVAMESKKIAVVLFGLLAVSPCLCAEPASPEKHPDQVQMSELLKRQRRICRRGILRPAIPAPPQDVLQRGIKGDAEAAYQLGCWFYDYHMYGEECVQVSKRWLELAAREGMAEAQWLLGELYRSYWNDDRVADVWFQRAIAGFEKRTDSEAYRFLYAMFYEGTGTRVDKEKAREYALKYVRRCRQENVQPVWVVLEPEIREYVMEQEGL